MSRLDDLFNTIKNTLSNVSQRVIQPEVAQVQRTIQPTINQASTGIRNLAANVGGFLNSTAPKVQNFLNSGAQRVATAYKTNPQQFNFLNQVGAGNIKTGIKPLDSTSQLGAKLLTGVSNIISPAPTPEQQKLQASINAKRAIKPDIINGRISYKPEAKLTPEEKKYSFDQSLNLVVGAGGAAPFAKSTAQNIAGRYASKLTKEDLNIIGKFAQIVEDKGAQANTGKAGQYVASLAKEMFGKDAETWGNAKLKNAFDLVLQRIGTMPNRAGFGQAVANIREEAPKIVEQKFRTDKINLNKDLTARVQAVQEALGLTTRKVRTFNDMKDLAAEIGSSPARLLQDMQNSRITDKEVVALKNLINNHAQRIGIVEKKLRVEPTNELLQRELTSLENQLNLGVRKLITGGTEAGRAVAAFRIIANKNLDPVFWLSKAKQQLGGLDLNADQVQAINSLIKSKDRLGLARFVSLLGESTGAEKAVSLWKAGLLTAPPTHLANTLSNTTMAIVENLKDIPGTALDVVASKFTGKRTTTLPQIGAELKGAAQGIKKGAEYFKTGVKPEDIQKADLLKVTRFGNSAAGKVAQKYTDAIYRSLGAEDAVFKEAAFQQRLKQEAITTAKNTGQKAIDLLKKPTQEMVDNAIAQSEYATFNRDNALASFISGGKRASNPVIRVGTEVLAPFSRTPTNVAEAAMDYTPLGPFKTVIVRLAKGQPLDQKTMVDAISRATTGTAVVAFGAYLAAKGVLTGASPASESERSQWELEGKTPNSILIGGKWRRLSRLSPLGNLLSIGAEWQKSGGSLSSTFAGGLKGLTEQTFLKGVSGGLQAVNDPTRYAESFVENTIASSIPSLIAAVARGLDPYQRQTNNVRQAVAARIPGARNVLQPKLDALGRPIKSTGGLLGALFDPFSSSADKRNDPVINELNRVGFDLNKVGNIVKGTKLTSGQEDQYQKITGQWLYLNLQALMASDQYKTAPVEFQNYMVDKMVSSAKDTARNLFIGQQQIIGSKPKMFIKPSGASPATPSPTVTVKKTPISQQTGQSISGGGIAKKLRVARPKATLRKTPQLKVVKLKSSTRKSKPVKIVFGGGENLRPYEVPSLA